jgi:hypothetical protein
MRLCFAFLFYEKAQLMIENFCMPVQNHILLYWVLFIKLIVYASEKTLSDIHFWVINMHACALL